MLKKIAVIIIIMVYGLASTGAVVHLDYCCGKLSNISLSGEKHRDDKCPATTFHAKNCCDSKLLPLQLKGEQQLSKSGINQKQTFSLAYRVPACENVYSPIHKAVNEYSK